MKKWLIDLAENTIIAIVLTLLGYILGFNRTWNEAAVNFASLFLILFVVTIYQRYIKNKKK